MVTSQTTPVVSPAPHLTYLHLLSVVNSEIDRFPRGATVRILDAGCGNGELIEYLSDALGREGGGRPFELFGFEVSGHPSNDRDATVDRLAARFPDVPWPVRMAVIAEDAPWPFADGTFDIVVSNQVLEHVRDHDAFFRETARVLQPDGFAIHLFPTRSVIVEPHIRLPFAHRIPSSDLRRRYIRVLSRLGLGRYQERRRITGVSLDEYARRQAEYLDRHTNFKAAGDLIRIGDRHQLRGSVRYTPEYYRQKARSLAGRSPSYRYRAERSALVDRLLTLPLRHIASTTLVMDKRLSSPRSPE